MHEHQCSEGDLEGGKQDDEHTCRLLFCPSFGFSSPCSAAVFSETSLKLVSPETLVSRHKIMQFYCAENGWNLAILGSNTRTDKVLGLAL